RRPEAGDVKTEAERFGDRARKPQHQPVDDQREDPERDDDDGEGQDLCGRTDERVHDTENNRDTEEREPVAGEGDARDEAGRYIQGSGVDERADDEWHNPFTRSVRAAGAHVNAESRGSAKFRRRRSMT